MENIEKIRTKLAQNKLKKILLKELKNDYYDNLTTVKELIKIRNELVENSNGERYYHIENIVIWQNGFITFNTHNCTTAALRMRG